MITRNMIIQEAQSWVGTRFKHQGRIKKSKYNDGGCDCLGLIIGIAKNLGITSGISVNNIILPLWKFDVTSYTLKTHTNKLWNNMFKFMHHKQNLEVGDIILFNIQNRPQHLAIYSYNHSIIHALYETRKIVEHTLDSFWRSKVNQIFSFKGISK